MFPSRATGYLPRFQTIGIPFLAVALLSQQKLRGQPASTLNLPVPTPTKSDFSYKIFDYAGKSVSEGNISPSPNDRLEIPFTQPTGFYEITIGDETTGHWVPSPDLPEPDEFTGMDTAISWLTEPGERPELIRNLRTVLGPQGLSRERFHWRNINPTDGQWDWETAKQYDTTRKLYQQSGIKILEVFHTAPRWMGRAQNNSAFPDNLVAAARSWKGIADHWSHLWGALEVWNEPNIVFGGNQPADQYVPLVKTLRRAMADSKVSVPLGGGVFAGFNFPYSDLAARNGLIDECDFISFHYYSEAIGFEKQVERYRSWLSDFDRETKPLWLTEMGAPNPGIANVRTSPQVQAESALALAMKTVEAKACGIARVFPFVYSYYSEKNEGGRGKHFGMLDHRRTPLRMLAATAHAGHELSGMEYIGDVPVKHVPGAERVRVFLQSGKDNALLVIYTGKVLRTGHVALPFAATLARGLDGRALDLTDGGKQVPVPDGITYALAPRAALTEVLDTQTPAMRLWKLGKAAPPAIPAPAEIVLQPQIDPDAMLAISSRSYHLKNGAETLLVKLGVVNLTSEARVVTLKAPGLPDRKVTAPPQSREVALLEIPLEKLPPGGGGDDLRVEVTGTADNGSHIGPVVLTVVPDSGKNSIAEHLAESTYHFALPIGEAPRWDKNASGALTFGHEPPALVGYKATFPKGGSRWAYPRFSLPQEVDLTRVTGVLIRARCMRPATVRLMTWDTEKNESQYYTQAPIIPADGEWHVVHVPLASFHQGFGRQTGERPQIAKLSIGFNTHEGENTLELSDVYMIGKRQ